MSFDCSHCQGEERAERGQSIDAIQNLYDCEELSDVRIRAGERSFSAHKVILSLRSSALRQVFIDKPDVGSLELDFDEETARLVLLHIYNYPLFSHHHSLDAHVKVYIAAHALELPALAQRTAQTIMREIPGNPAAMVDEHVDAIARLTRELDKDDDLLQRLNERFARVVQRAQAVEDALKTEPVVVEVSWVGSDDGVVRMNMTSAGGRSRPKAHSSGT